MKNVLFPFDAVVVNTIYYEGEKNEQKMVQWKGIDTESCVFTQRIPPNSFIKQTNTHTHTRSDAWCESLRLSHAYNSCEFRSRDSKRNMESGPVGEKLGKRYTKTPIAREWERWRLNRSITAERKVKALYSLRFVEVKFSDCSASFGRLAIEQTYKCTRSRRVISSYC